MEGRRGDYTVSNNRAVRVCAIVAVCVLGMLVVVCACVCMYVCACAGAPPMCGGGALPMCGGVHRRCVDHAARGTRHAPVVHVTLGQHSLRSLMMYVKDGTLSLTKTVAPVQCMLALYALGTTGLFP